MHSARRSSVAATDGGGGVTGPLLTARQVSEALSVSPETVLRWTRRGELPAIRLPSGAIRYRPDDLNVWLDEHATAAPGRGSANHPDRRRRDNANLPAPTTLLPFAARDEEDLHAC
jgi:excisionase family DNA binding protein